MSLGDLIVLFKDVYMKILNRECKFLRNFLLITEGRLRMSEGIALGISGCFLSFDCGKIRKMYEEILVGIFLSDKATQLC